MPAGRAPVCIDTCRSPRGGSGHRHCAVPATRGKRSRGDPTLTIHGSKPDVWSSVSATLFSQAYRANVAQLVEQLIRNEQVTGSSPVIGSIRRSRYLHERRYFY